MKFQKLSTLLIALIGFYTIFNSLTAFSFGFMYVIMSFFTDAKVAAASLVMIPQFLVPSVFGILLVRKSPGISSWLLSKVRVEGEQTIEGFSIEDATFLLFSALGLYMLCTTVPGALKLIAAWIFVAMEDTSRLGISANGFWEEQKLEVIYHVFAIGFSCFVFFRGVSVSRFVLSLRKGSSSKPSEAPPHSEPSR